MQLSLVNNIRQTSIETYRRITSEGLLPRRRMAIWKWLYAHGKAATANEIFRGLYGKSTIQNANISPRLGEMVVQGVVEEVYEGPCSVTGNLAIFYQTTDNMPKKLTKKKTKIQMAYEEGYKRGYDEALKTQEAGK